MQRAIHDDLWALFLFLDLIWTFRVFCNKSGDSTSRSPNYFSQTFTGGVGEEELGRESVKCFLPKREDLSSIPGTPIEKDGHACNPIAKEVEAGS